jgi:polyphenol oxidase
LTEWRERHGVRWLEAELPGGRVAFSSRVGGTSEPPYDSLNLGILTGDGREAVIENRRRLAAALDLDPGDVVMGLQVHGADVASHDFRPDPSPYAEPDPERPPEEVDAHVTGLRGLALAVLVADCLPVAIASSEGVAIAHCGWRGLAGGVLREAVAALGDGDPRAGAIGPGIGPCCYEVGEEVLDAFADLGEGVVNGRMLDLREVVRRQLAALSVEVLADADLCTSCNPDLFFSHRRDGERSGRQAGLVWRT